MATNYAETEYVFPTVICEDAPGWYAELDSAHRPSQPEEEQGHEAVTRTPQAVAMHGAFQEAA